MMDKNEKEIGEVMGRDERDERIDTNRRQINTNDELVDEDKLLETVGQKSDEAEAEGVSEEIAAKNNIDGKKAAKLAGILVLGLGILIFGTMRIKDIIGSAFVGYGGEEIRNKKLEIRDDANMRMKELDTDKDGVSDYDEIYVYKTSAYIDDTDSDGVSDGEELKNGSDPLCPEGQDCYSEHTNDANAESQMDTNAGTNSTNNEAVDIEKVRAALVAGGMDEATLNQVDDAALLEMYQETVKETGIDPLIDTNQNTNSTNYESTSAGGTNEDLTVEQSASAELSADKIRALLIENGVDAGAVNAVDDATLLQMYEESLK